MLFSSNRKRPSAKLSPHSEMLLGCPQMVQETDVKIQGRGFSGAVVSDTGCTRSNNEDNYVLGKYMNANSSDHSEVSISISDASGVWHLAGVFDGMGGGEMGELAAHDTAAFFLETFNRLSESPSKAEIDLCVRKTFLEANNRIVDLQREYQVFGTTGTILCTNGLDFKIYHLGDSRAYLIHSNELLQLTKDQTLAQMKLDVGMYRQDTPPADADKHKLTDYIGRDWTRENIKPIESYWMPISTGDHVLLCSDGLYDMCSNEEIKNILLGNEPLKEKVTALVERAISKGGEDNITCLVVSFT